MKIPDEKILLLKEDFVSSRRTFLKNIVGGVLAKKMVFLAVANYSFGG